MPEPSFIGRREELERLVACLTEAENGRHVEVVIGGDPGIGKSRLVREFVRAIGVRARVAMGRAESEVLLSDATIAEPLLLVFDDVDRAEAETLAFVAKVRDEGRSHTMLVLSYAASGAYVPDRIVAVIAPHGAGTHYLRLQPLSEAQTRLLLGSMVKRSGSCDETDNGTIAALAGGNPRYALELSSAAAARPGENPSAPIPEGMRLESLASLARIAPELRRTIVFASVLGDEIDERVLGDLADGSAAEVARALQSACDCGLLVERPEGTFAFRYAVQRHVLYETITTVMRRELHRRAVRALVALGRNDASSVAAHWVGAQMYAEAASSCLQAARERMAVPEFSAAAGYYRLALAHIPRDDSRRIGILRELAHAITQRGVSPFREDERLHDLGRLRDPFIACDTLAYDVFDHHWDEARLGAVMRRFDEFDLPPSDVGANVAKARAAFAAALTGHYAQAEAILQTLPTDLPDVPVLLAQVFQARALAQLQHGPVEGSIALWRAAIDHARRSNDPIQLAGVLSNFASLCAEHGLTPHARIALEEAFEIVRSLPKSGSLTLANAAMTYAEFSLLTGQVKQARTAIDLGLRQDGRLRSGGTGVALLVGVLLDDAALVENFFDPAALEAEFQTGTLQCRAWTLYGTVEMLCARGERRRAAELVKSAFAKRPEIDFAGWMALCVARLGSNEMRQAAMRRLAESESRGTAIAGAMSTLCEALAASTARRRSEAKTKGLAAARRFADIGWRYHEGLAREAAGDRSGASRIFEEIGDHHDVRRLRARSRAESHRGLRGEPLTARERQVAELASAGLTDREIGNRLGLSSKTIGHHLEAIYSKLGIRSRWMLAEVPLDVTAGGEAPHAHKHAAFL